MSKSLFIAGSWTTDNRVEFQRKEKLELNFDWFYGEDERKLWVWFLKEMKQTHTKHIIMVFNTSKHVI